MAAKYDSQAPPSYPSQAYPPPAHLDAGPANPYGSSPSPQPYGNNSSYYGGGPPQQGYGPPPQGYYGGQQQGGYGPPQGGGYYGAPQQGLPQQGMYYQQGYPPQQQKGSGAKEGILGGLIGLTACCCCLDCLF
ncbi:MAG: hypothetical protein M1835_002279 [Candelina submexicana]|nr:MAG: hypothetical protein M1835_002279 [Candelina submexicana]